MSVVQQPIDFQSKVRWFYLETMNLRILLLMKEPALDWLLVSELLLELHEYLPAPGINNIELGISIMIDLQMNHYWSVVNDYALDLVESLSVFLSQIILVVFSLNCLPKVQRKTSDVGNDCSSDELLLSVVFLVIPFVLQFLDVVYLFQILCLQLLLVFDYRHSTFFLVML